MKFKITDYPTYTVNPFEESIIGNFKVIRPRVEDDKSDDWVSTQDGEVITVLRKKSGDPFVKDMSPFCKLFFDGFEALSNISEPARKILCYIGPRLPKNKSEFYLDVEDCMKECKYTSKSTYYDGVANLMEHKFIAKKVGGSSDYFINVGYIYNGQRGVIRSVQAVKNIMLPAPDGTEIELT